MRTLQTFILILLITAGYQNASAQCCSAGNPFFYGEQSNLNKKHLQVIAGYKYSSSDDYYNKDHKEDIDFVDKSFFNYLNLQMIYGLTSRLNLQMDMGYFINKTEQYSSDSWNPSVGHGLGDLLITAKYLVYDNFHRKLKITPSIGVKFPVGVFDQEVDNVKLPITVQPSSGSYKYSANVYVNKGFKNPKWNLGVFGSFEYSQLIDSKNFYYKYGNTYLFSGIMSYTLSKKITLGLEARSETRGKSHRDNDQTVESSGYTIVYAIPHISYTFAPGWYMSADYDLPVYRYYNGIQLANKMAFSVRLSYNMNFNKKILNDVEIKSK